MTKEEIQELLDDLEEYKTEFYILIDYMKDKGINYSYDKTTRDVEEIYTVVNENMNNLLSETPKFEYLEDCNKTYLKRLKVIGICLSLFNLCLFNIVIAILGKNNSVCEKCLAILCGIIGFHASNRITDDLEERFARPYVDNDELEQYYAMEDKRDDDRRDARLNIKALIRLNKDLRKDLIEKARIRKRKAKEREKSVINELKG